MAYPLRLESTGAEGPSLPSPMAWRALHTKRAERVRVAGCGQEAAVSGGRCLLEAGLSCGHVPLSRRVASVRLYPVARWPYTFERSLAELHCSWSIVVLVPAPIVGSGPCGVCFATHHCHTIPLMAARRTCHDVGATVGIRGGAYRVRAPAPGGQSTPRSKPPPAMPVIPSRQT